MANEIAFGDVTHDPLAYGERASRESTREGRSVPFWGLMAFTFVLLLSPQTFIPGLADLMPAKLAMGFAMVAYVLDGRRFPVTPTVQWAIGLVGCAILSIPLGFWPGGSVSSFFDLLGKSLVVFLLIASVVDTVRRLKILIAAMVGCGAIAALYAVYQYRTGALDPTGQRIAGFQSPLASNPNDLALTLNILFGLSLGLLPVVRGARRMLLLAAMAFMVAGIVSSFSRGGFVTFVVVGVVWAVQAARTRGVQAIAAVMLVALVLGATVPSEYVGRLSTIFDSESDPTGSSGERWVQMERAIGYMAERPLFGIGIGNSRHLSAARGGIHNEAHNAYIKAGAEMGVIGMVVYTLFVFSAFAAARSVRRRLARRPGGGELARLAGGVELATVAFAVGAMFSPVTYHFYFYYPAGLAVAVSVMAARLEATPPPEEATTPAEVEA
jgi:putative inorganic carbon (HCO3(-)) transporter